MVKHVACLKSFLQIFFYRWYASYIGKKDQGTDNRPRYLLVEFANATDRNSVKKNSEILKENDDTKNFYMKADSTKKEREEYERLYDLKKKLEEDDPGKSVRIDYGKLYVEDNVVDQVHTANSDFLWDNPALFLYNAVAGILLGNMDFSAYRNYNNTLIGSTLYAWQRHMPFKKVVSTLQILRFTNIRMNNATTFIPEAAYAF